MKTEHAGAKNGGGHWGTRTEAKNLSRTARRLEDKMATYHTSGTIRGKVTTRWTDERGHFVGAGRIVTPFGSPATLPLPLARIIEADDNRTYDLMVELGEVDPRVTQRPYVEVKRAAR